MLARNLTVLLCLCVNLGISANSQAFAEMNEKCARFVFNTFNSQQHPFVTRLQKAVSYQVKRKSSQESRFVQVFAYKFPKTIKETAEAVGEVLPEDRDDLSKDDKKKYKKAIDRFNDSISKIFKKDNSMLFFSLFNTTLAKVIGNGYYDCSINKNRKYSYQIEYRLKNGSTFTYPQTPVTIQFKELDLVPPEIDKIEAGEAKSNVFIKIPSADQLNFVLGFNLYRKSANQPLKKINSKLIVFMSGNKKRKKILRYIDRNLTLGVNYTYILRSVSFSMAESKDSKHFAFRARSTAIPPKLERLKLKVVDVGFKLKWSKPIQTGDIIGYEVYRANGNKPNSKFEKINKVLVPTSKTEYLDLVKFKQKRYLYRVAAVNKWGNIGQMSATAFVTYFDKNSPNPPVNITGISKKDGVHLSWKKPVNSPIAGYLVYRAESREAKSYLISDWLKTKQTTFIDKNVRNASGYWYSIISFTANKSTSIYPAPIYVKIKNLRNSKVPKYLAYYETDKGIKLRWKKSLDYATSGFNLYRNHRLKSRLKKVKLNNKPLRKGVLFFLDKGKFRGKQPIQYQLHSINQQGKESAKGFTLIVPAIKHHYNPRVSIKSFRTSRGIKFTWVGEAGLKNIEYQLFRKSPGKNKFKKIKKIKGQKLSVLDRPKKFGNFEYYFLKLNKKFKKVSKSKTIRITYNQLQKKNNRK